MPTNTAPPAPLKSAAKGATAAAIPDRVAQLEAAAVRAGRSVTRHSAVGYDSPRAQHRVMVHTVVLVDGRWVLDPGDPSSPWSRAARCYPLAEMKRRWPRPDLHWDFNADPDQPLRSDRTFAVGARPR